MKKTLIVLALVLVSLVLVNGQSFAITGPCSGCHTMHNSQNGTLVNTSAPNGADYLLVGDCYACHSINGTAGIVPKVDNPVVGSNTAAGNFATGAGFADTDAKRHNVAYFGGGVDAVLGQTPPGSSTGALAGVLTCAGTVGCHGNPSIDTTASTSGGFEAMSGFHHNSIAGGAGYRFLRNPTGGVGTAIGGLGSLNWEMGGATATNHNVYQAGDGAGVDTNTNSISGFCAKCHDVFHGNANTGGPTSPFNRHPTDQFLTAGMIAGATVDYNLNPFAFANPGALNTTTAYTTANAQVACVSCHRSHGSEQADLLRFDYTTQQAGAGTSSTGCLGCHVTQR